MKTHFYLCIFISSLTFVSQLNTSCSWSKIRLLNADENLEKACKSITSNYTELLVYGSLDQYVTSQNVRNTEGRQFLLNLIIKQSFDGVNDFISEIAIYLVMIVLAVIALISIIKECLICSLAIYVCLLLLQLLLF